MRQRFSGVRRLATALAAGGLALAVVPGLTVGGDPVQLAAKATCTTTRSFQMVEANVKSGMTQAQTKADLAKVFADKPDFVALNEVAGRSDAMLAPTGYAIWRTPGRYTGANPVVWRTDRWNAMAQGTMYVSNVGGKLSTQTTELGIRYANWVTLKSADGCQTLSVVSYHVAPKTEPIGDLLIPSVDKLGGLANQLAADGPVLLAGDLNQHYRGRLYPRTQLTSYQMTPTWDMTGTMLPTHSKATIDYIFVRNAAQFAVTRQVTRDLYSDHNAVVANLTLNPRITVARTAPTFVRGHVVNIPTSTSAVSRRAVISRVIRAVGLAPAGATVQVATQRLGDPVVLNALRNAYKRGVIVQLVTTNTHLSTQEKALMSLLGTSKARSSWAIQRPWRETAELPQTAVMVNRTADVQLLAVQVDQPLDYRMALRLSRGQFTLEKEDFLALRAGFSRQIR